MNVSESNSSSEQSTKEYNLIKRNVIVLFWALHFTILCYGINIFISLQNPNSLSSLNNLSNDIKFLILGAFAIAFLPATLRTLRNRKKLIRDIDESTGLEKNKLAIRIIKFTVGFEVICVLGYLSFCLGFSILWSIIGLIVGTLCKLSYVPVFLKLKKS